MAKEIEIKLRVEDAAQFRRAVSRLGARAVSGGTGRVHEWNVVFDTAGNELKRSGQLLRIRTETRADGNSRSAKRATPRTILTFKRPSLGRTEGARDRKHKIREELELEVADAGTLTKIFEGLGMRACFRYEKFRTMYRLPDSMGWAKGLMIELDETPIGVFVELEGPAGAIDRAAKALGFSKDDYILTNYLRLFAEECGRLGVPVGDMVFRKRIARGALAGTR
jgi:adenylate cyclase class 2